MNSNSSWKGGLGVRFRRSCFVGQPLALCARQRNIGALHVIDAKLFAGVLAEIELRKVAVKMLGIDVLINADDAALKDRKEAFQRVRVHVAARPLVLGMVNRFVLRRAGELEHGRAVSDQPALAVKVLIEQRADAAMVDNQRADLAAALDKAQHLHVGLAAVRMLPGLARAGQFRVIGLDSHARAAQRARIGRGCHHVPNPMAKVPRGLHAAIEGPLKLAGRDAFFQPHISWMA